VRWCSEEKSCCPRFQASIAFWACPVPVSAFVGCNYTLLQAFIYKRVNLGIPAQWLRDPLSGKIG
jgi:hypothetical protein